MHVYAQEKRKESNLAETGRVVVQALLIALVIRTLLFQPFNIPSGSMKATLLVGDYLFVSQYSYGYSRYSLPFSLPLFSGRIFGSEPKRGDVAVFRLPRDTSVDYIKRVIGLPGDRIDVKDNVVYINGKMQLRTEVGDYVYTERSELSEVESEVVNREYVEDLEGVVRGEHERGHFSSGRRIRSGLEQPGRLGRGCARARKRSDSRVARCLEHSSKSRSGNGSTLELATVYSLCTRTRKRSSPQRS